MRTSRRASSRSFSVIVPRPPRRRKTPCSLSVRESNISTRCDSMVRHTGRQENQSWPRAKQAPRLQPLAGHEVAQVGDAAGVAPLVVVPGDSLYEIASDDHRRERVEDAAQRVTFEVGGDEWFVAIAEVASKRLGRGVAEGLVHFVDRNRPVDACHEVAHRDSRRRDPESHAVEAAFEARDVDRYDLPIARRGSDDVYLSIAATAAVL